MSIRTIAGLRSMQAAPLEVKIVMSQRRIMEWVDTFGEDGVSISFSGGLNSTVLLDIARKLYPGLKAMFVDIPTQYPELKQFVQTFENVDIIKPKMNFFQVCTQYGLPLVSKEVSESVCDARKYLKQISEGKTENLKNAYAMADMLNISRRKGNKENPDYQNLKNGIIPVGGRVHKYGLPFKLLKLLGQVPHTENGIITDEYSRSYDKSRYAFFLDAPFEISDMCCKVMKKRPAHEYQKRTGRNPMTAQMAEESMLRTNRWIRSGCNMFDAKWPLSNPMSFWTEQDMLRYVKENNLPICSVYGKVVSESEEMGQTCLPGIDMPKEKLRCTGCRRTGCVCCAYGAHMPGDTRFVDLKKTHPQMYKILDVAQNNGYTMRQAIEWMAEHGKIYVKL